MNAHDRIRVQHMLDAATEATAFIKNRTPQDLRVDRMLLLALVKENRDHRRGGHPAIGGIAREFSGDPWAKIKGMRNRLIHAYSDVNVALVWGTVISDLPALVGSLEALLTRNE